MASNSAGIEAFSAEAIEAFERYLQTSTNRKIFDPARRAQYRNYLSNPDVQISKQLSPKTRARLRAEKQRALGDYCLKDNQLYRRADKQYDDRVVAITHNVAQHIIRTHEAIGHTGARKTHQKLLQEVYGVSQDDVEELLPFCKVCLVNRVSNTGGPLEPI